MGASEILLSMSNAVSWVSRDDVDPMPLTVVEGMPRIVSDAVLIPEFVCEFVEGFRDLVSSTVVRESRNQPRPAAAYPAEEF